MGKRKVSILEPAADAVADIALFIEGKGMPKTAKKFVDKAFEFFETLSDERIEHKPCNYNNLWKYLDYRCVTYKKYVVAYLSQQNEIIICDFVASKLLK
jgi:plasmid stabilization system protein ParE